MKHIAVIILFFFFVFGVPFSFLPVNTSKLVVLFLIVYYLLLVFNKKHKGIKIKKEMYYILVYLILLLSLSVFSSVFHATSDFAVSYAYFIMIFEVFLGSFLFYKLFLYKYTFEGILDLFIWIALIQSLIIILMLVLEPFREFIMSISTKDITDLIDRYGGFRGFGLAGSVTYDLAVFLSISMMFITFLISTNRNKRYFYIISWLIIFVAVLMTGRSGWIGVFLSIVILFYFLKNKNSLKSIVSLLLIMFFFVYFIVYILSNYYLEVYDVLVLKIVPYAFEMFFNFYEKGSFSTDSSDHLSGMYFSISEKTFFFGDGYYANPTGEGYYMSTDAGYMRQILFYGIMPSILLYSFYLFGFYKIYKHYKVAWFLIMLLASYYFLVQYKGAFLTGSPMNIKLFFILLVFSILSKNNLSMINVRNKHIKKNDL